MADKQYYGIKFPCTANDNENYYLDVNKSLKDKVRSLLMHLIFTPKNQRIRKPDFGTDLIRYIFEMNDTTAWNGVKSEVQEQIEKYITNISINDIIILKNENDEHEIYVRLDYTVINGATAVTDSVVTKI